MILEPTRKTMLAVRVLRLLRRDDRLRAGDLAGAVGATSTYLSQVMAPLLSAGWVESSFGPGGGYRLSSTATELCLLDVLEAVEGPLVVRRCLLSDGSCPSSELCELHKGWLDSIDSMIAGLRQTPLGSDGGTLPSRTEATEGTTKR